MWKYCLALLGEYSQYMPVQPERATHAADPKKEKSASCPEVRSCCPLAPALDLQVSGKVTAQH